MIRKGLSIAAMLAGATVGATMGVLMAPDKGKETRKKLSNGFKSSANDMNAKVDDLKQRVQGIVSSKQVDLNETIDKFVSKADHKKDDIITILERKLGELKNTNLTDKINLSKNEKLSNVENVSNVENLENDVPLLKTDNNTNI